jgi:uroporphyrin-III C-methyltransferase
MDDDVSDHARSASEGGDVPGVPYRRPWGSVPSEGEGESERRASEVWAGSGSIVSREDLSSSGFVEPSESDERFSRAGSERPVGNRSTTETERAGTAGTVSLVGSGPGHPDLLTRRAWKRLSTADVVLYDSLVSEAILAELPDSVATVDVGKRAPNRTSQDEINALLCERAQRGERVVRLKGGDPCLFGRGGEEATYLANEGLGFEIVPGISSVLAAPSVSGIPLTHRGRASSVTVLTGHETPEKDESALDWEALATTVAAGGTLVILMGVKRLPENVRALREQDLPPETPVAMIQEATREEERTIVGTLETIVERRERAGIEPPAVTIVGDVVSVREAVEEQLLG